MNREIVLTPAIAGTIISYYRSRINMLRVSRSMNSPYVRESRRILEWAVARNIVFCVRCMNPITVKSEMIAVKNGPARAKHYHLECWRSLLH